MAPPNRTNNRQPRQFTEEDFPVLREDNDMTNEGLDDAAGEDDEEDVELLMKELYGTAEALEDWCEQTTTAIVAAPSPIGDDVDEKPVERPSDSVFRQQRHEAGLPSDDFLGFLGKAKENRTQGPQQATPLDKPRKAVALDKKESSESSSFFRSSQATRGAQWTEESFKVERHAEPIMEVLTSNRGRNAIRSAGTDSSVRNVHSAQPSRAGWLGSCARSIMHVRSIFVLVASMMVFMLFLSTQMVSTVKHGKSGHVWVKEEAEGEVDSNPAHFASRLQAGLVEAQGEVIIAPAPAPAPRRAPAPPPINHSVIESMISGAVNKALAGTVAASKARKPPEPKKRSALHEHFSSKFEDHITMQAMKMMSGKQKSSQDADAKASAEPMVDMDHSCPMWAAKGECENNAVWMLHHCRKSCTPEVAGEPVEWKDTNRQCPLWASGGECIRNKAWMQAHCAQSCGIKKPQQAPMEDAEANAKKLPSFSTEKKTKNGGVVREQVSKKGRLHKKDPVAENSEAQQAEDQRRGIMSSPFKTKVASLDTLLGLLKKP